MARPFHGHTTLHCTAQRPGRPVFCGGLSVERRGVLPVLPRGGDQRAGRRSAAGSYCNLLCHSTLWVHATRRELGPSLAGRARPWPRRPPGTAGATSTHRARTWRVTPRVTTDCVWKIPALGNAKLEAPTRRPASVDDRPAMAGGAKRLRARPPVGQQREQVEDADGAIVVEVGRSATWRSAPCRPSTWRRAFRRRRGWTCWARYLGRPSLCRPAVRGTQGRPPRCYTGRWWPFRVRSRVAARA